MNSRNIPKRTAQGASGGVRVAFIIPIVLVVLFLLFWIFLSGGVKGLIHNFRPLPNFTEGEPAVNREAFNREVAAYDQQLSSLTEKSYQLAYIDACERSLYDLKVKSDYLSSCEKEIQKVYLSKARPCSLLSSIQNIVGAEAVIASHRCPNVTNIYNSLEGIGGIEIEIADKRTATIDTIERIFESICLGAAYCKFDPADSLDWQKMIQAEDYQTILVLNIYRTYYKK